MSFTPGPWSIDGDILISEYIPYEETVLARVSVIHDLEGHERNAIKSLIAAAPELLEALEAIHGSCDLPDEYGLMIEKVIAKARGEGA